MFSCRAMQEAQNIFPAKYPIDNEPTKSKVGSEGQKEED